MSRVVLCTILAVLFVSCVHSQIAGGFNPLSEDRYNELIETINGLTHTGELAGAKLIKVNCATSQVVAGANYIVNGQWKIGDDKKDCLIKYSRDLDGNHKVTEVKCGVSGCTTGGISPESLVSLVG